MNVEFNFATEEDFLESERIFVLYPINPRCVFDGHIMLDRHTTFPIKFNEFDIIADIKQYNWTPIDLLNHELCSVSVFKDTISLSLIADMYFVNTIATTHLHTKIQVQRQLRRRTVKCVFV